MPDKKCGKESHCKGVCTETTKSQTETGISTSESDEAWKSPSQLKEEVQTIIDIMGPSLSPNFQYNTSSEADNEESIFTNSKLSSTPPKKSSDGSEKTDMTPTKDETTNISTAAYLNSTSHVATIDEATDPKVTFSYTIGPETECMCPPPMVPVQFSSECMCPQVASMLHGQGMMPIYPMGGNFRPQAPQPRVSFMEPNEKMSKSGKICKDSKSVMSWFKTMVSAKHPDTGCNCGNEYYKMNIKKKRGDDHSPPSRVVFDLVQNKNESTESCNMTRENPVCKDDKKKKNITNERLQSGLCKNDVCLDVNSGRTIKKSIEKTTYCDSSGKTRVDVYYFDHGSCNYYQTTDAPPLVTTETVADKTEKYTTRFWAEIFGTIHIGFSFVSSFILQFFRFILYSILRPLTIGLIQLGSDYLFKPLLVTLFNGIIQPILIFIYNIASSIRDICDPLSEGIGYFLRELAVLVRAFRIVEVNKETCKCNYECKCNKKSKRDRVTC